MSLLRRIQEAATTQGTPLSDLLRQCKVLAKRLQHQPLSEWADRELNGYSDADELPPYRRRWAEAFGNFMGPFRSEMRNYPIPSICIEEDHRQALFENRYYEGVAHYEALLRSSGEDTFRAAWPADIMVFYRGRILQGYDCVQAWRTVSRGGIEGMLDQVRNRILAFALEIEDENPDAGEASPQGEPPVAAEKVDQIYTTMIFGGTNVVASGSQNVIKDFELTAGDWSALQQALRNLGVPDGDIADLETALEADAGIATSGEPGPAVKEWLGDVTARLATGSLLLANNTAGSMIAGLVLHHLGII